MGNFWHNIGEYVIDHMGFSLVYIVLFIGVIGVLFDIVSTAVYALMSEEKIKGRFMKMLYIQGKYSQERLGYGGGVYAGGSPIALIGISVICGLIALVSGAVFFMGLFGYLTLGSFVIVPGIIAIAVALLIALYAKAHLKRWKLEEHTLDVPQRFEDPFLNR